MNDEARNVTHDLILTRNCTIPDENCCNDPPGRTQRPLAAQVQYTALLPQHHRSLSFHISPRHIERHKFSLRTVCSQSKYCCSRKNSNNKNNGKRVYTTNCHLKTASTFTSLCVFYWITRNQKFTTPVFPPSQFWEENSNIFSLRRKRRLLFEPLPTDTCNYGNILLIYVEIPAFNDGASYRGPAWTIQSTSPLIRTNRTPASRCRKFVYYKNTILWLSTKYYPNAYCL
jgi:hypothetical protein